MLTRIHRWMNEFAKPFRLKILTGYGLAPPKQGTTNFEILQADDECRHNIEHMSKYVSVGDLIEDVKNRPRR